METDASGEHRVRRFTANEAIRMVEEGIIGDRAGVETYWLLDLAARCLEVRTTPEGGAYQVTRVLGEDDVVEPPGSDVRWTVRDLLP
jgi:hypothetical protein